MKAPSPSSESGRGYGLLVTIIITTAAAAVTAGVTFNERHPAEAVVQRAEASPTLAAGIAAPAAPARTRREQWRDPWKRHAPLSESAPTSAGEALDGGATLPDPSLPVASEALKGASGTPGEPTPTF